jgi:hypothetical protein
MTLATAWSAANPFGQAFDPDASDGPAEVRQSIAQAVRLIANATAGGA